MSKNKVLHPDDVLAVATALDLLEIDQLFWEIEGYLEEVPNHIESAYCFYDIFNDLVQFYLDSTPENERDDAFLYINKRNLDKLNYFLLEEEGEEYGFVLEPLGFVDVPLYVYYAYLAYCEMTNIVYGFLENDIDKVSFLRQLVILIDIVRAARDLYIFATDQAKINFAKKGAAARHEANRRYKAQARQDWSEEHNKTGISRDQFAEKNAAKYYKAVSTVRRWLQGYQGDF